MPERAELLISAIARHKALSVAQMVSLCDDPRAKGNGQAPSDTERGEDLQRLTQSVRKILQRYRTGGVLERAWLPTRPPTGVWYLTEKGARYVANSGLVDGHKGTPAPPGVVAGLFQSHNLAVNDVGVAFHRAARQRGDTASWSNEIRHSISNGYGRERTLLIADALVQYQMERNGAGPLLLSCFVELDRGTVPVQRLVDQVLAYARLQGHRDAWSDRYPTFPVLLIVLAGKDRSHLERRIAAVTAALRADPRAVELATTYLGLFEDVKKTGPFSTIWRSVKDPDVAIDVLGRPGPTYLSA